MWIITHDSLKQASWGDLHPSPGAEAKDQELVGPTRKYEFQGGRKEMER